MKDNDKFITPIVYVSALGCFVYLIKSQNLSTALLFMALIVILNRLIIFLCQKTLKNYNRKTGTEAYFMLMENRQPSYWTRTIRVFALIQLILVGVLIYAFMALSLPD
jgi:hypothetical protein